MNGTAVEKSVFWHLMLSVFLVLMLLGFLMCDGEGLFYPAWCFDYPALFVSSILVRFPLSVIPASRQIEFFIILSRVDFGLRLFYKAFNHSLEIDWSSAPVPRGYFTFNCNPSNVFYVLAQLSSIKLCFFAMQNPTNLFSAVIVTVPAS